MTVRYELQIMTKTPGIYKSIYRAVNSFEEVKRIFIENNYITKETKVWSFTPWGIEKLSLYYWYGNEWKNKIMVFSPDEWYDVFCGKYWYKVTA